MSKVKKLLWEAQLRRFPESRRLSKKDICCWVFDNRLSLEEKRDRALQAASIFQYEHGIWYTTHQENEPASNICPQGGAMGFRFGVRPEDYRSGFTYSQH